MKRRRALFWVLVSSEFALSAYFAILGGTGLWNYREGSTSDNFGLGDIFRLAALVMIGVALCKIVAATGVIRKKRWAWWLGLGGNVLLFSADVLVDGTRWWANWLAVSCSLLAVLYVANRPNDRGLRKRILLRQIS